MLKGPLSRSKRGKEHEGVEGREQKGKRGSRRESSARVQDSLFHLHLLIQINDSQNPALTVSLSLPYRNKFVEFDMKPVCKKCYEKFPLELKKRLKKLAETVGRKQTSEYQGGDTQQNSSNFSKIPETLENSLNFRMSCLFPIDSGDLPFRGFQKPGILRKLLEVCSPTSNAET